jgi:periplasmic protein TonB
MGQAGFFEQKSASPTRFALVAAGHAAVLAAVMLAAGPQIIRTPRPPLVIESIPLPKQPEPDRPQPDRIERQTTVPQDRILIPERRIDLPPLPPVGPLQGTQIASNGTGTGVIDIPPLPHQDPPPLPVRRGAEIDPRFASALQPRYPAAEQRAQRNGTVVIRVTIGTDGRVRAAERVSATSDAFWDEAERQALSRWRFRPATVDGRPVESTRVMTINFRIEDA